MIYDAGLTAVLFLSCRPPSVADHSQHTQHFLWTDCGPYVVPLPALLSAVLIYLIDYEPNPRIFLCISACAFPIRRNYKAKDTVNHFLHFDIFFPFSHLTISFTYQEIMITCKGRIWLHHACDFQLSGRVINVAGQGYTSFCLRFKPLLHVLK